MLPRRIFARIDYPLFSSEASITFSFEASLGRFSVAFFAPFRMDRTLSGVISEAPSFTFADAVMFVGRPFRIISLSKSTDRVYARFWGGISFSLSWIRFRLSATMQFSFLETAFRYSCSDISSLCLRK